MRTSSPTVRRSRALALVVVSAVVLAPAAGCDDAPAKIRVTGAEVSVPAGSVASAYFTVHNDGGGSDSLVGVSTTAAESAMLHRTEIDERGVASMSPIDQVYLDPHSGVRLGAGGTHVMLVRPDDLRAGDRVTLVLRFRETGRVTVSARVTAEAGVDG